MRSLALTRETVWRPAYSKRDPDPSKDYGVHGVEMIWALKGPAGAVTFMVFTNWMLSDLHGSGEYMTPRRRQHGDSLCAPMAAGFDHHSAYPLWPEYEDINNPSQEHCDFLDGRPCWFDGSVLNAGSLMALLYMEGGEAVWQRMERQYWDLFGKGHAFIDGVVWAMDEIDRRYPNLPPPVPPVVKLPERLRRRPRAHFQLERS